MTLAAEYDEMLDSCNQKIDSANRDLRARGEEIERLSEQVEALTQQQRETATTADKDLGALKAQLASLQASSSQTIADLQTQLKKNNDEAASLSASSEASKNTADKQVEALTAQGKKYVDEIAALKKRISEVEAANTATNKGDGLSPEDGADLARQIVELTKTNEQLQTHLVNLAKEFQGYKETSLASMAASEEKAAQRIVQLQKERDTLAIKLEQLANKSVSSNNTAPPPLPAAPAVPSSSTDKNKSPPGDSEQTLVSLRNEYHVYKYTAENELAVANDTAAELRRANQLLQNEIDQLTEDFDAYKKTSEETIADLETLHAARYHTIFF